MKNKNYGITLGGVALTTGGFFLKFLWFILLFILVWGFIKSISESIPFFKNIREFLKLDKLDTKLTSILDFLYKHLPDFLYSVFLLQVPIISGLILFSFPLISQFLAANFLQNIFVMKDGLELILVMVFATLTAIAIMSLLKTILVLIDNNFNDNTESTEISVSEFLLAVILSLLTWHWKVPLNRTIKLAKIDRSLLTFILFLPTWGVLLYLNNKETNLEDINWVYRVLGILIGIIPFGIAQSYEYEKIPLLGESSIPKEEVKLQQRRNRIFLGEIVVGVIFYMLVIFFNRPSNSTLKNLQELKEWQNWQAPTLLHLLLLIWIFTLFMGVITLIFDKSIDKRLDEQKDLLLDVKPQNKDDAKKKNELERKTKLYNHTFYWPVTLFLIVFAVLGNAAFGVDHFFKLEDSQVVIADYQRDFQQAIWNRLCEEKFDINNKNQTCDDNKPKSLAVVAASGGGIQASGWMTQVLVGLQNEKSGIGEDFIKGIGLISSASGGSVGSMFYLNEFDKDKKALGAKGLADGYKSHKSSKKNEYTLSQVVENATDDWLNSVGWGFAFPDLLRTIGLPLVLNLFSEDHKYLDRGYALEKNWQKTLTLGNKKSPTLDDRHDLILKGQIPIAVYNTTLVENGRPFYVSSMKFVEGTMENYVNESSNKTADTALDFKTVYNNCGENGDQSCDLALTTAARLSASFPYVTPMARNDRENIIEVKDDDGKKKNILQNYHIADGGYYDNAGAFTAMNWLNKFLEYNNDEKNKGHRINIKKVIILQINAFPEEDLKLDQKGSRGFVVSTIGPLNTLAGIRDSTQIGRNKIFAGLLNKRWENIDIKNFTISFPQKDANGKDYNPPLSWRLTERQKMNLVDAWEKDTDIRETVECMKDFWKNGKMALPKCQKSYPSAS